MIQFLFLRLCILEHTKKIGKGLVYDLEQQDQIFTTSAEGSELYEVEVVLEGGEAPTCAYDYPYDWGEYCKPEIAVFYAIRERISAIQPAKSAKQRLKCLIKL